jgi:hypothetical protein
MESTGRSYTMAFHTMGTDVESQDPMVALRSVALLSYS